MNVLIAWLPYTAAHARHVTFVCACLLLCLLSPVGLTADLAELQVSETAGMYRISLVMRMPVPAHYVYRVLTDYEHIYRLDPTIIDSRVLPSPAAGIVRVMIRIQDCIAFFCRKIDRVEDVRELQQGRLEATTIPELSHFSSGHAEWRITDMGDYTQVAYQAQMEPDFYIPPLIGSYFVRHKLKQHMLASLERIECIARIQANLEGNTGWREARVKDKPDKRIAGRALAAGGDPTLLAQAAAGGSAPGDSDCPHPCRLDDEHCRP